MAAPLLPPCPHSHLVLFQRLLLVICSCSDRTEQTLLFPYHLDQVVPRVGSYLVAPPFFSCPPTLSTLVSSNGSCLLLGPAQIGPNKESYFLSPRASGHQSRESVGAPPFYSYCPPRTSCFGLFNLFLLVNWSCSDRSQLRVLFLFH